MDKAKISDKKEAVPQESPRIDKIMAHLGIDDGK